MKKILIGILLIALTTLYSCASTTVVVDSQKDNITTSPYSKSDEVTTPGTDKVPGIVDERFIGVWSTDELKTNQILIFDITMDYLKFNSGINGYFGFDATAIILDGEIVFGDGVSPYYSGPDGVKGKLKFSDNSITVIYTDFGSLEYSEFYPNEYTFTIRDENSDEIVNQYKSNSPF